jgi:hypothetical protein
MDKTENEQEIHTIVLTTKVASDVCFLFFFGRLFLPVPAKGKVAKDAATTARGHGTHVG